MIRSEITFSELVALVSGSCKDSEFSCTLTGFAALAEAIQGELSFFGNSRYEQDLKDTEASVVLVPIDCEVETRAVKLEVENPSAAFSAVVEKLLPPAPKEVPGIHPSAVVDPTAEVDPKTVTIHANATVSAGAKIGAGTVIFSGAVIGRDAVIGENCVIHANASIYYECVLGNRIIIHSGTVIGSDGFGFEPSASGLREKVNQRGIVQIDDDVEIGANTSVDRARFGRTWIKEGTKVDNQCQIAHNVVIGRHCILVAFVGISGSSRLGDNVIVAAQAGVAGHITIGEGCVIGGKSGVTTSIPAGSKIMGHPTTSMIQHQKSQVMVRKLPEIVKRLKAVEKKISDN